MEFVAERVWGQTCDYVHRTVIIANMCNFIWAGNKTPHLAGKVTCCTVHGCEKWVSRYAQDVDGFCNIITLFMRPMSRFSLHKVKAVGNKLTGWPRATSVCTRVSTVIFSPPFTHLCKQLKNSQFLANKIGHPHPLCSEKGVYGLVTFWYGGMSFCSLLGLAATRYPQGNQGCRAVLNE